MSASLVGSEMCIRDRNNCRLARPAGQRHVVADLRRFRARDKTYRLCRPCLLYTSDAADDM
eukprot:6163100-Alexandrium_andersonii.AAC.1